MAAIRHRPPRWIAAFAPAALLLPFLAGCSTVPAGDREPLRIAVLSDFNSAYGSTSYEPEVHAALQLVTSEWRPDLVLIPGDMIAGQRPSLTDANVRSMWAAFDSAVAAPLRRAGIPFAFTIGNHDGSGHPGHERDRRLAREHWTRPGTRPDLDFVDDTAFPFRYAFLLRDVFVLVIDASTGAVATDSAQLSWIRRMLSSDAARAARTRIVLGHVPLYAVAVGRDRPGEVQAQPDTLRRILERGDVAMYVAGHHHAYYPGRRGELLVFSAGALGEGPRPLLGSDAPPFKALTLLTIGDAIRERTFGIAGDSVWVVDAEGLPERIGEVVVW